jgi:hypothetical protein
LYIRLFLACSSINFALAGRVTFFARAKNVTQKTRPERSCCASPQPALLPTGRRDSIGLPWPIDPTSKASFGELTGGGSFPVKFAEVFVFGRENQAGRLI